MLNMADMDERLEGIPLDDIKPRRPLTLETNGRLDMAFLKKMGPRRLLSPWYVAFIAVCVAVCLIGAISTYRIHDYIYTVYFCIIAVVFAAIVPLATSAVIRRQMRVIRETTGSGSVGYRVIADDSGLHIDNTDTNGHVDIPYAQVRKAYVMKEAVVVVTNARQMIPMFPSESVSVTDISYHLSEKGIPVSRHI